MFIHFPNQKFVQAERQQVNGNASASNGKVRGGSRESNHSSGSFTLNGSNGSMTSNISSEPTWVHEIFQGIMTSETRCLNCETVFLMSRSYVVYKFYSKFSLGQ